jgi:glycerol-3-phosphate dehydrogenase (NAD(P)+)
MIETIGIVGGGAWGTALAVAASRAGRRVVIWARDAATVSTIADKRENPRYLPGVVLDDRISATSEIAEALAADAILLAVPAQTVREVSSLAAPHLPGRPLVICAKGLESGTGKRLSEVVAETVPHAVPAVLSGPSFAADVGRGLPTAVTIAANDENLALVLSRALGSSSLRPYAETDMIGVEIGGAVKNVLAIAAGIVAGNRLGASAGAALVARGFAELRRLGEALGAQPATLMGLSGLGDLVLTCSGPQSRNFAYGFAIGEGRDPAADHPLVEGIATASVARDLSLRLGVTMPIVRSVAAIISDRLTVADAVESLMTREIRRESD